MQSSIFSSFKDGSKNVFNSKTLKKIFYPLVTAGFVALSGCENQATIASQNLSTAADNFEINRRIIFYNGITDTYMMTIEGQCSIKADTVDKQLEVTCKTGENQYKKHFLGLSNNMSYFVEQLDPANANPFHYRVVFRPQTIVPDVDFQGSASELQKAVTPSATNTQQTQQKNRSLLTKGM